MWLKFSAAEKARYAQARVDDTLKRNKLSYAQNVTEFGLRMALRCATQVCAGANTKLRAIMSDLKKLSEKEPHMHVVIFTQHLATHAKLVQHLEQRLEDIQVYEITGQTPVKSRHKLIRDFQKGEAKAKAMVAMLRTAACGITLTAATRVYLLEPCFDPSEELQAAGRIHRLGQSKEVLCKRFCFRNSVESCIVSVHEKLKAGTYKITDKAFTSAMIQELCEE